VEYTSWEGWLKLDAHERALGAAWPADAAASVERERIKVVSREEMVAVSTGRVPAAESA